jgi:hypothetical protein
MGGSESEFVVGEWCLHLDSDRFGEAPVCLPASRFRGTTDIVPSDSAVGKVALASI